MRTMVTTALLLIATLGSGALSARNVATGQGQSGNASPPRLLAPELPSATANVQIELSISDYVASAPPQKKTVSMLVAEGYMGRVRSNRGNAAILNVDATPRMQKDGRISLQLTVEYRRSDVFAPEGATVPFERFFQPAGTNAFARQRLA